MKGMFFFVSPLTNWPKLSSDVVVLMLFCWYFVGFLSIFFKAVFACSASPARRFQYFFFAFGRDFHAATYPDVGA